jgi:hypothetical protein
MATDWSITHSPRPRYLPTHFDTSLFSPATLSVLKLGLERASVSFLDGCRLSGVGGMSIAEGGESVIGGSCGTHVRPVERFIPAKKAETVGESCQHSGQQR